MNNLEFQFENVTKSYYLNDLNSQLWIYAERGAAGMNCKDHSRLES